MDESTTFAGACLPIHFQLRIIWERLLQQRVNSVTANFFDLGGTEQLAAAMLKEAEREIGHGVRIVEFQKNPNIAALADVILASAECKDIEEIQQGNGEAPFFYLHGDILGGGFYTRRLAEEIGVARPFYSLPLPAMTRESLSSIESVAAEYCVAIRQQRPHGPYVLGGFSLAALFAYEVARQLSAAGEKVEAVVLIDPELPTPFERLCLRAINSRRGKFRNMGEKVDSFNAIYSKLARLQYVWQSPLREKARFVWRKGAKLMGRPSGNDEMPESIEVARDGWRVDLFQWLATAYALKRYDGTVTLLLTDPMIKARPSLVRRWRRAVAELRVHRLPGSHMTTITTYRDVLASKIRQELQIAQSMLMALLSGLAIA